MDTLAEYQAEIQRLAGLPDQWQARADLRYLSVDIRRKLWRDRKAALAVAKQADDAAGKIEVGTPGMIRTDREPRWPAAYQAGIWSREIM